MEKFEDLLGAELSAARRLKEMLRSPFGDLHEQMMIRLAGLDSPSRAISEQMQRDDAVRRAMFVDSPTLSAVQEAKWAWEAHERWREAVTLPFALKEAQRAAQFAQGLPLPDILNAYRSPIDEMALKLARTHSVELLREPAYLTAFSRASALADLYGESTRVSRAIAEANRAMMVEPFSVGSLADYRDLLNAAGLTLPRWPRVRLLTRADKRRRFRERLRDNVPPPHVMRAKSLVHRYELTLREILDAVMAEAYGEDWPDDRLPLCDCKDLLGRWKKRGGAVLDHADYAHYARIMSHPEHFEAVFQAGFEDSDETFDLLSKAGRLRAASHHPHVFTPEDLRDLRLIWRTIEKGLIALDNDYTVEGW